jgi:predicted nucleotidyltransferase
MNEHLIALEPRYIGLLVSIIEKSMKGFKGNVFLFGSRARGNQRSASDIDLAISPGAPKEMLSRLRENLENSILPFTADVVDLSSCDQRLAGEIQREGVLLWND